MAAAEPFGGDCEISDEKIMNRSSFLSDGVNMDTGYIEKARLSERGITEEVIEDIAEAAKIAKDKQETEAVFEAFNKTPGLNECPIAPDVLAKLLPDEDVVVLPKLDHVGGGVFYRFVKRAFDIISCSCALVILAIPMVVIAAAIKRHDPGPAIYAQTRVEQVIIRHNFGSCLLNTIKAQLDNGFELVSNKPKCAFGRKGRDSVLSAASMMVAA